MLSFLPWGIECNVRACGKKGGGEITFYGCKIHVNKASDSQQTNKK